MVNNKIKISELAKDFDLPGKDLCAALSQLGMNYKPAQSITQDEAARLFDYLTQTHQAKSLEEILAPAAQAAQQRKQATEDRLRKQQEEAAERIRAEEKAREEQIRLAQEAQKKAQEEKKAAEKARQPQKAPAKARPQAQTLQHTPPAVSPSDKPVTTAPRSEPNAKRHYVDTRGNSVNIAKYDERLDTLVPQQAGRLGQQQGKQKLVKKDQRGKQFGTKRRQEEQEKMRRLEQKAQIKKVPLKVQIPEEISVGELALRMKKTAAEVIKQLMKLGVMASVSQNIDYDTASLVAMELGCVPEKEVVVTIEERLFDESEDNAEQLVPRAPVVVVMGHVDHGKTSLLDAIRNTHVTAGEAGGITQHIGAYRVKLGDRDITFLDTPGHAAFTSMRARGAQVTDIAILVVAADDGIMPQTIEAINHAKAAGVPLIVAVNKIDKHNANPDRVLQQLTEHGLVPEEWGGETIVCPISALKGEGIDNLLEMVLLTADMLELKANPNRLAKGTVIEAKLDRGRGPVATVLIQNGTLHAGDIVIAGTAVGRVRAMNDEKGRRLEEAGPSVPVEIVGLAEVPGAGDLFYAVEDERMARTLAEQRKFEEKEKQASAVQKVTLENLFSSIEQGNVKDLNIIVKADVQGSAEAVKQSLEKISNDEVRVRVIHAGVGAISKSDVDLADASNAIIIGFNVRPDNVAKEEAAATKVEMRMYRVIYDAINDVTDAMKGMLAPKFREVSLGELQVRQVYKISNVGTVAGCRVTSGKITRDSKVRVVRDGIVITEDEIASLKRFKDDAKEVAEGYECGVTLAKFADVKEGDVYEAFKMEEYRD